MRSDFRFLAVVLLPVLFHALASPAAAGDGRMRLEDMDLALVKTGWGKPQRDLSAGELPITIGDKAFPHGLGVHAPSECTISLDGGARAFTAMVGVNASGGNEVGQVEFKVNADGKEVWRSGRMAKGEPAKALEIPLAGVRRLTLVVDALGDNSSDHANWADAVLTFSTGKPALVDPNAVEEAGHLYPPEDKLRASPGKTRYFVDPARGDDANAGTLAGKPWKSLARVNAMRFAPGDTIHIAAGVHDGTLKPSGAGTAAMPVVVEFAAGRHDFTGIDALRRPYFVSNSCDAPQVPKPIGILFDRASHFRIQGADINNPSRTLVVFGARVIQVLNDHAAGITIQGIAFDLKRPTVSEFRVLEAGANHAVIQLAEGSEHAIENGKLVWKGDWGQGGLLCQEADPAAGTCVRRGAPNGWTTRGQDKATAAELGGRKIKLDFGTDAPGLTTGHQYHFRLGTRDSVAVHNTRSKGIVIEDCQFHALTNMGFVSQFTDNIRYRRVHVAPPANTIRTCAAWADIFQFSNCKGDILVEGCRLSGMQDDAINCHGTHLRIVGKPADNKLLVRFMHPQTYGFAAFQPGDEIAVINYQNLREYPGNPRRTVTAVEQQSAKDWLLSLDGPAPKYEHNDAVDNVTWHPNLTARDNHVSVDPVRGFLLTSRGKLVIEGNTFHRTAMPAILVENDASGWFESGPVRDLLIRNNRFVGCGIQINPHNNNEDPALPVHENIRIENNRFENAGISAKSTSRLVIRGNSSPDGKITIHTKACADAVIDDNNRKH